MQQLLVAAVNAMQPAPLYVIGGATLPQQCLPAVCTRKSRPKQHAHTIHSTLQNEGENLLCTQPISLHVILMKPQLYQG